MHDRAKTAPEILMLGNVDLAIIFSFLGLMVLIGLYANSRQKDVKDFFVAGGRLGSWSIACIWVAAWVGGAAVVGGAAKTYEFGISAGWYVICMAIGCLLFGLFFAARVKRWGQQYDLLTYPELIEKRYDSRTRIVATVTTILAYVGYAAGQLAAAGAVLSSLLGWDYPSALLLAGVIIVLYTAAGGFLAVTYTDWVQFAFLFVGVVIVGIPISIANGGTVAAFTAQLPAEFFSATNWGLPTMLALAVSIPLSFFVAMDSFTRMFAAKSPVAARRGTLLAAALLLPLAVGAVWLGMTAALLYPDTDDVANILPQLVLDIFPVGLKGIMLAGILAALMSTADICILTASANGSRDIYQRYVNPSVAPKRLHRLSMWLAFVIGTAAALMAWRMQDVLEILLVAFTINAAALFVPTITMATRSSANRNAAFWSITLALIVVIAWYLLGGFSSHPLFAVDPLWPGLLVSAVSFLTIK